MVPLLSVYASFMPYSAKTLTSIQCNGRHGAEVLDWEELGLGAGLGGRPCLALLCQGCVGGEWRTEHLPVILPDSPGAWEVGVSLSEGEGGPAGAQELGYFCNTEHIRSQLAEVKLWAQGWNARGQVLGGAVVLPLLEAWRAPAMPFGEGGATHSKMHGVGRHWALVLMVMV